MFTKNLVRLFANLVLICVVGSCAKSNTAQIGTPHSPILNSESADFLLAKGTTWIYSFDEYEPIQANVAQVTTATYHFTEIVVETESTSKYFVAHVQRDERFVKADSDWVFTESSRPKEYWYIVSGQQVFESFTQPDLSRIQLDSLFLVFDFPLSLGKSWCPRTPTDENKECRNMGKSTIVSEENYETPIGTFKECYKIVEDVNSGGVTRWFCKGVGVVAQIYDHAGTKFGFTQVLIGYVKGSKP